MSKIGLSKLNNLSEIQDASLSLNNLFSQVPDSKWAPINKVTAGTGSDINVFNENLNTTTVFTYLPANISFSLSSSILYTGSSRYIVVDAIDNIPYLNLNFNITEGDAISADNIYFNTEYSVGEIYPETDEALNSYYKLIFANNKTIAIDMPRETPIIFIKRNSQASIQNDLFILGISTTASFTQGDIINSIYYTFDTTTAPLLSSNTRDYYIVDYELNDNNQVRFGLSSTLSGARVSLSSINALSAVSFVRNTAVTQNNFLNIIQPATRDPLFNSSKTYPYTTIDESLEKAIVELEVNANYISGILPGKLKRTSDNVVSRNINISGVLKVDDPNLVNKNTISTDDYSPSIYILDNTGNFNAKTRIYSNTDTPWTPTVGGLSATKDLTVESLDFEHGISIDKVTISELSTPLNITTATIKVPITVVNNDNTISIYYAFASLAPVS